MWYGVRVLGWLLLGMCLILAILGVAGLLGMSLDIDFFGLSVSSTQGRIVWVIVNGLLAIVGLAAISWSRSGSRRRWTGVGVR